MDPDALRESAERQLIRHAPEIFDVLKSASERYVLPTILVLAHRQKVVTKYEFRHLDGRRWVPPRTSDLSARTLMRPLWEPHLRSREGARTPSDFFIAFDLDMGRVWYHRVFQGLLQKDFHERIPIDKLRSTTPARPHKRDSSAQEALVRQPTDQPPQVDTDAELVEAAELGTVRERIGPPADRPEEVFLLGEDLLRLAADSLDGTERLDPLPAHLNALWVFSRPVLLMRPDGRERHIRAVWFRQGAAMWRMRAYARSVRQKPVITFQVNGGELAGRIPFVPQWDPGHPEQKLLTAVWALMQQGDVTQTDRPLPPGDPAGAGPDPDEPDVHIVRLRAGTEHARMYQGRDQGLIARAAWSVRGHWRRQPYPSLGLDEKGKPLTKLIWIASYAKGDPDELPSIPKVIEIR